MGIPSALASEPAVLNQVLPGYSGKTNRLCFSWHVNILVWGVYVPGPTCLAGVCARVWLCLGPDRFKLINNSARNLLVELGYTGEQPSGHNGEKRGGKKK